MLSVIVAVVVNVLWHCGPVRCPSRELNTVFVYAREFPSTDSSEYSPALCSECPSRVTRTGVCCASGPVAAGLSPYARLSSTKWHCCPSSALTIQSAVNFGVVELATPVTWLESALVWLVG